MSDQPITEVRQRKASRSLGWWLLACVVLMALCYLIAVNSGPG